MIEVTHKAPVIREGRQEDAVICAGILNDWIDGTSWMPRVHTHEDVVRYYQGVVFADHKVFVAGDGPDGFLVLDEKAQCITALYVSRPGEGLGTALLDQAKKCSDRLCLWTFVANQRARRFYDLAGFVEERRTDGDNEEGLPDILLQWQRT